MTARSVKRQRNQEERSPLIRLNGVSTETFPLEPHEFALIGGTPVTPNEIDLRIENEEQMGAFNIVLKWIRREASLQKSIESRNQFWNIAWLAWELDMPLLRDDLTVAFLSSGNSKHG